MSVVLAPFAWWIHPEGEQPDLNGFQTWAPHPANTPDGLGRCWVSLPIFLGQTATKSDFELFEAAYRAQSTGPAFIVDDALLKDADGNYFHLATRQYFKFFKMGRESWTN